jgi:hypothetical protein
LRHDAERAGPYVDRMSNRRSTDEHVALPHYTRSTLVAIASLATLLSTMLVGGTPAWASPMTVPVPTAKVDCVAFDATTGRCEVAGVVYATTQVGALTYIGGSFTSVSGVPRSNVAAIRADGSLDPTWNPSTNGVVYALAASSDGSKVFLGGGFTTVGGQTRGRLAVVTPDTGQLVPGWTTVPSNNLVRALVVDSGDRLYVGGSFGRIGGRAVGRLAALSQSTGAVDTGFVPNPSGTVRALTLSDDGTRLYAGGPFTAVRGVARPGVAELEAASGALTSFAPTDGGVVISMDTTPSGRLFFGTTSNRTWAYDPAKGGVPEYRIRTGGDVQGIYATDEEVYIGGHFNTLPEAKLERVGLASFLPADGQVTGWNPGANGPFGVWTIAPTRTAVSPEAVPGLSIGGDFTVVGGVARRGYARFNF